MITFNNNEPLDLNAIRLMGASVKGESAIGYFGTGLKYALAVLLRTGHSVVLTIDGTEYPVTASVITIRGQEFKAVCLGDEQLGFTTELGRNWKTWMAYRELYSNMLDEDGWINDEPGRTSITVSGPEINAIHANRQEYFIADRRRLISKNEVEFYEGASRGVFFRGVRVFDLHEELPYTINMLRHCVLTEDRTLCNIYRVGMEIGRAIGYFTDPELIRTFLITEAADKAQIDYSWTASTLTDEFKAVARACILRRTANKETSKLREMLISRAEQYPPCEPTVIEARALQSAQAFLKRTLGVEVPDVIITEAMPGAYAAFLQDTDQIVVSRQTLQNGRNFIAATLFEEWCHKTHNHTDESREFQQYLLDRIISLAEAIDNG